MNSSGPEITAKRDSWKVGGFPESRHPLDYQGTYTLGEFEHIKRGFIPKGMEDKWFIFYESPWLYFHRSWKGECVFGSRFERHQDLMAAVETWVAGNVTNQSNDDRAYAKVLLAFLVDALLLRKNVSFPVPSNLPVTVPKGLYQHSVVGRGYPEVIFPMGPPVKPTMRTRLRCLLQKRWDPFRIKKLSFTRWIQL